MSCFCLFLLSHCPCCRRHRSQFSSLPFSFGSPLLPSSFLSSLLLLPSLYLFLSLFVLVETPSIAIFFSSFFLPFSLSLSLFVYPCWDCFWHRLWINLSQFTPSFHRRVDLLVHSSSRSSLRLLLLPPRFLRLSSSAAVCLWAVLWNGRAFLALAVHTCYHCFVRISINDDWRVRIEGSVRSWAIVTAFAFHYLLVLFGLWAPLWSAVTNSSPPGVPLFVCLWLWFACE